MKMQVNIAVFASGSGSNALKIIEYFKEKPEIAAVRLLVANKPDIGAIAHARQQGIPHIVVENKELREAPQVLLEQLRAHGINFIALAGFLAKVPDVVTAAFAGRLVNIHPALLPLYGGKGMYGVHVHSAVLADGRKQSGITVHQVNEVYDDGEILHQASVNLSDDETVESLQKRIQTLEHYWYPRIIERTITSLQA